MLEGINGLLPNLDLVNIAVRMCSNRGILTTLNGVNYEDLNGYGNSMENLLIMMKRLAFGQPIASHSFYLKYREVHFILIIVFKDIELMLLL